MPKATQQPQCKAALIKFAWEFPLQLEADKIKCQDLGKRKYFMCEFNLHRKEERAQPRGRMDLPGPIRDWLSVSRKLPGQKRGGHPKNRPPHLTGLQRAGGTALCSRISPPKRKHMNTEPWPQHGETEPTVPGLRWPKSPVRVC